MLVRHKTEGEDQVYAMKMLRKALRRICIAELCRHDLCGKAVPMWVCRNVMFTTHEIDGWNPTHKNADEWGMVCYCYTNINELYSD